mmetsp:Transcript_38480/g.52130  ORF Transcript_38480/g.52130 Transcript_38480/m.52130 type:complete len:283 (-) Transcript_38480:313-1161(-)|eukprot:CAMPEP_0185766386 /NCGR_PEP_ID=MMETSP1174-20130828/36568_1 /TAXON_ID=35687 /ORGANISM="Dictyocha speculum, Strain CCMP1381" /LENGTH=282 /DNA_ID=CAMNT_0028450033 /DNA_START=40 /DNA_END=888 /DNA_ORIENTATION=-
MAAQRRRSSHAVLRGASTSVDSSMDPKDPKDQLEMFLFKFPDVQRSNITHLLDEFTKFDRNKTGSLQIDEAMMLLEHRGETKTLKEFSDLITGLDTTHDGNLNFLEWCCGYYHKSWADLHEFTDQAAFDAAMEAVKAARHAQDLARESIRAAAKREEEAAKQRAEELEAESKLTGVSGAAAFFKRQMVTDSTEDNMATIKAAAARRKALREAKIAEKQRLAEAEGGKLSAEAAMRAIEEQKAEQQRVEKEAAAKVKAEQKAKRDAFKAKQRAMFEKNAAADS